MTETLLTQPLNLNKKLVHMVIQKHATVDIIEMVLKVTLTFYTEWTLLPQLFV